MNVCNTTMNSEYSALVTYITPEGEVNVIGSSKANAAMENFAPSWKEYHCEWGKFFTELHQIRKAIDELGEEHEMRKTRSDGRKLRYNEVASKFFNTQVWGTCFIKPFSDKNAELGIALRRVYH